MTMHLLTQQTLRFIKAFGYSLEGLKAAFVSEPAFVIEIICSLLLLPIACLLPLPLVSKALLISSLILVLIVELINSAIEATIDRISSERHPLAKKAKDIGSAAVLLSLINAAAVWGMILWPVVSSLI
ncbi:MAG: diacylglycerol kinase [Gammaproteobacteria bacterium 39-13]|nr:MAG: diacylglycerol kinase [Gammaproteobacteria bacterium 39-13]